MTLNLATLYEAVAAAVPGRVALVCGERRLTFAELDARADEAGRRLRAAGIAPGEHVGVHMLNGTEYVETLLGCLKIRAVPVNINYRYTDRELHYLYTDAGLAGLVVDEEFAPAAARVAGDCPGLRVVTVVRAGEAADGPGRRLTSRSGRRTSASATTPPSRVSPTRRCGRGAARTTGTSSTRAAPPATPRASCGGRRTSTWPP